MPNNHRMTEPKQSELDRLKAIVEKRGKECSIIVAQVDPDGIATAFCMAAVLERLGAPMHDLRPQAVRARLIAAYAETRSSLAFDELERRLLALLNACLVEELALRGVPARCLAPGASGLDLRADLQRLLAWQLWPMMLRFGTYLARHERKHRAARALGERIARHNSRVWLVNTGWSGGAYGVGTRMKIGHTRAMIRAVLNGELDDALAAFDAYWDNEDVAGFGGIFGVLAGLREEFGEVGELIRRAVLLQEGDHLCGNIALVKAVAGGHDRRGAAARPGRPIRRQCSPMLIIFGRPALPSA